MPEPRPSFTCPVCEETVPPNAKACPSCGACDKSGWSGDPIYDALDLPDAEEEFDYDRFVEEEFGSGPRKRGKERFWWIVAVVVLIAFVLLYVLP